MSLQLNPQDIPKSLPSPTVESPIITISHAEPVSAAPKIATPDTETTLTPTIRNSPQKPTNPYTTLKVTWHYPLPPPHHHPQNP